MRILVAGASGAIGRQLLPMLSAHDVTGTTRSRPGVIATLGATPLLLDVFDRDRTIEAVTAARPEVVVSLLTDLATRDYQANSRLRREGFPNLAAAAVTAGARRLVVESIGFDAGPAGNDAVAAMEGSARGTGLEVVVLRFGLLWGPGTWYEAPEAGREFIHVRDAAAAVLAAIEGPTPA